MPQIIHPDDPSLMIPDPANLDPGFDLCGWVPHADDVDVALSNIPQPLFGDAAPHLANTWDGKTNIKLWDACIRVTGANLPAHKQTIGDCVSQGHGSGIDYLRCIQIALKNLPHDFKLGQTQTYTEAIYGMMRQRANQLSNQDGAAGIWAVESLVKDGAPIRNGRPYKGSDAKLFGARGTPVAVAQEGAAFKLAQYISVRQTRDAADLLFNGNPITVCSNQGFSMVRNSMGICEPQGNWGHCMLCIGAILVNGTLYFMILQSWGQNTPSGPTIENMPDNAFLVHESIFQRMLGARDSYALVAIPGVPAQDITTYYV
jgi:hypothetical protein